MLCRDKKEYNQQVEMFEKLQVQLENSKRERRMDETIGNNCWLIGQFVQQTEDVRIFKM